MRKEGLYEKQDSEKRIMAVGLSAMLAAAMFAGCGSKSSDESKSADESAEPTPSVEAADDAAEEKIQSQGTAPYIRSV